MTEQLRLEGEGFEPIRSASSVVDGILRAFCVEPIKRELNSLWFARDWVDPVQHLFEREPSCGADFELGEEYLSCYLAPNHSGDHYDGYRRLYWRVK